MQEEGRSSLILVDSGRWRFISIPVEVVKRLLALAKYIKEMGGQQTIFQVTLPLAPGINVTRRSREPLVDAADLGVDLSQSKN